MEVHLTTLDWWIIGIFFAITLGIGVSAAKISGKSKSDFFLGGRAMPWWLLGFSMVATTFSTDVPNLVTGFVRQNGIFGNWNWWAMLPSGMLTVFLFARLWRRSGALTDLEFYEQRYSGKGAAFLRGFRAVYLGFIFSVLIMASVTLAAIKIGASMLNLTPMQSVVGGMVVTVIFCSISGLRGVLLSDFVLFIASMVGAIGAAYFSLKLPEINGLDGLMNKLSESPEMLRKTQVMGYLNTTDLIACFIMPFAVIWWSVWYPGAEPGGGGFIVQRMLAAKNESHAVGATMLYNVCHYALRPWPWLLVALCSIIVYPDRQSLINAVGNVLPENQIQDDVAYSLMLTRLPAGWRGIVVASLAAAYISTISTLLNWGASYLVHDFYGRFINTNASEKRQVRMGQLFTLALMIATAVIAFGMESATSNFAIILSIGAGTGLLYMVRWYWWRINAASEITAMISSFLFAVYFNIVHPKLFPDAPLSANANMILSVALTTLCWVAAAFWGPQNDKKVLYDFVRKLNPAGPGWSHVRKMAQAEGVDLDTGAPEATRLGPAILVSVVSCIAIYAVLIGTGDVIYHNYGAATLQIAIAAVTGVITWQIWKKYKL